MSGEGTDIEKTRGRFIELKLFLKSRSLNIVQIHSITEINLFVEAGESSNRDRFFLKF